MRNFVCEKELAVVAEKLVANGGGAVVGGVIGHFGENLARKVDTADPAVIVVISLVINETTVPYNFPIQPKDINRRVVAARNGNLHHPLLIQSSLDQQEAVQAGVLVKRDDLECTKVGSCYKIEFDKQESALRGAISLESRLSRLLKSVCIITQVTD